MSAPSTSGLSVELLLRVIDVKYGCFTLLLLYFSSNPEFAGIVQGEQDGIIAKYLRWRQVIFWSYVPVVLA